MKVIAFIPARLESKRFPNKVLKLIYGIPMIEHVRRRALLSGVFEEVVVVTNSQIISKKVEKFQAKVELTKKKHLNGTSRVSEITKNYKFDYACILFADEPFINPDQLTKTIKKIDMYRKVDVFNLITNLKLNDLKSKEVVKTVTDNKQNILNYFRKFNNDFMRSRIRKSSGILIFKKKVIENYNSLKVSKKEKNLKIEQFRLLENNIKIKSILLKDIYPSINTKEEFKKILNLASKDLKQKKFLKKTEKFENFKL